MWLAMVWFVAASTIPRAVPSSKEFWTMQCEADCDSQNLKGGVRAQELLVMGWNDEGNHGAQEGPA